MAMKTAAQMLDELMGKHRNTLPEEVVDVKGWREPNVRNHNLTILNKYLFCILTNEHF